MKYIQTHLFLVKGIKLIYFWNRNSLKCFMHFELKTRLPNLLCCENIVFYTEDTKIFSFNMFSKKSSELFEINHKIV